METLEMRLNVMSERLSLAARALTQAGQHLIDLEREIRTLATENGVTLRTGK